MSREDDAIQDVRDFCAKAWTEYREQAPMHEILRMSTLLPFLLNRIDAQAEQIATLKDIATQERAAVLTADICDGGDGYGGLSIMGRSAVDGEPTRADDYAGSEERVAMARRQLEAEYEAMRK